MAIDLEAVVRPTAVGAVHAACASGLDGGAAGQSALELEEGSGDLVADAGVAFVVDDVASAAEEVAAAGAGGGGVCGVGVVGHFERLVVLVFLCKKGLFFLKFGVCFGGKS
jgi:hypothetical protein